MKEDVQELDANMARHVLMQMRPVTFLFKATVHDDPLVAELRKIDRHVGFIADWHAEIDSPFEMAELDHPFLAEDEDPAVKQSVIRDIDNYEPSMWKEPHTIAVMARVIQDHELRLAERDAVITGLAARLAALEAA
jgi:hypothetical protein